MPQKMPPLPTTGHGGQEPLSTGHQVIQVASNGERMLVPVVRHPRRHERPTETSHVDVQTSTSSGGTSSSRTLNNCTAQGRATDDSSSSFHDRLSPETRLRNDLNCDKITPGNLATAKTARNGGAGVKQGSASLQNLVNGALPYCSESEGEKRSPRCRTTRSAGCSSSLPTESVFLPPPPLAAAGGQIEAGRAAHRSSHRGGIAASDYSAMSQATIFASSSVYRVANDNHAPSSTTSTIATNTSGYGNNLGTTVTTHTSSTRTPSLAAAAGPSTSSWNNSNQETESDYVVDPVKGNTYYKGQFLGKGGFAKVYLMTDVTSGNQYACKIIPKNRMQKIHMQKIAREIMIHKELNHVNVVQMHHYFEDNLNAYMLLEACPRKSLMHVLKYRGKVTEPEARYYMKQMVTGVAYIHSQKVVHRDLKPGNMFLSEHMIVKIGDFGLATRPDGQRRRVTICGTPNYIAPEVLYKQAYSYEADVWALGCILYALLVGQPPFETATLKETYARICSNQYKEVDDTIATRSGQDLVKWLLQPTPALRPSLEKVKEHAYLTKEFVPASLPHTSCYQMPPPRIIEPPIGASEHQLTHSTSSAATLPAKCKEAKVHWLVRRLPKLPRFRQRLSSVLCPSQKKSTGVITQSMQMHKALDTCMSEMKTSRASRNPATVDDVTPLFVTKWIDYSNKYGLSFQLSDRSVGVLFNDSTKMSYTHDRRRVEYITTDDEIMRYNREKDVPAPLQRKLTLMIRFIEYMDDHLTEGGEVKESSDPKQSRACVPRMKRWLRTNKAIVMELTIPLLQVNFFVDHTKMVVSQETPGRGYLITYIDAARHASSYWLNDLRDFGCTADLYERLNYVCKVAHEFAELDRNMIV